MYDFEWHKSHGAETSSSADLIVCDLLSCLEVASVLDIGCGDGRWLRAFKDRGVRSVVGVDGPWTDQARLLIGPDEFQVQNLEEPLELDRKFDLVISTEVAEHVGAEFADQFVQNAANHSDLVLFGAAIPYQGGFRHVNEAWPSYWAEKFARAGYASFDLFRARLWDHPEVSFWYKQNMILYVRSERREIIRAIENHVASNNIVQLPLNIVHPEIYSRLASYKQIAFRPLLRELPNGFARKAAAIIGRKS